MRALLDLNVLIALLDKNHVHHLHLLDWWNANKQFGWASCPLTENGLVRVMSGVKYPGIRLSPSDVLRQLESFINSTDHQFWSDDLTIRDFSQIDNSAITSRQITDVYLLALAVQRAGRFVTLDKGVSARAVRNAPATALLSL